jgi:hypothetical protein
MGAVANLLARVSRRARAGGGGLPHPPDTAPASEPCWVCCPDDEIALREGLMCRTHLIRIRDVAFAQGHLNSGTRAYG